MARGGWLWRSRVAALAMPKMKTIWRQWLA